MMSQARSATKAEVAKRKAITVSSFMVLAVLTLGVTLTTIMVFGNKKIEDVDGPPTGIVFGIPVQGEFSVLKNYSSTELQYNKTLNQWRSHKAMSLEAAVGTPVVADYAGTIAAIQENMSYGTTITIDHGNGLKSVYANLQKNPSVSVGDHVEKGSRIGSVGTTAVIFQKDPPHLYIEVYNGEARINPRTYINFHDGK